VSKPDKKSNRRKGRKRNRPETLEERILLSGTWVDADSGDPTDGATDGNDTFNGMSADDVAAAMDGNDNLFGNGGDDSLFGGAGDDLLSGGSGDDTLNGGSGTDTATFEDATSRVVVDLEVGTATGQGSDTLTDIENVTGSDGNDIITGDSGANTIDGGAGDDYVEGGGGNDTIIGGSGNDVIDAGSGDDLVSGDDGDDLLIGGTGNDTVTYEQSSSGVQVDLDAESATGEGQDTVIGFENITGSAQNDTLLGDAAGNTIDGGDGDDNIQGRAGDDTLIGEAGADTIDGGVGNDVIDGGIGNDILDGGEGDDLVYGGSGNDTVSGGAGDDTLMGEAGDDILDGGSGDDLIDGGSGNDQLRGGTGDDVLIGGAGNDTIDGGSGIDTVSYENATGAVNVDLGAGTATGEGTDTITGVESVIGSSFGDSITGDSGDNTLSGGAGNDVITGGAGADTIDGGAGDDMIHADADDVITGGSGTDTVSFSESSDSVRFDLAEAGVEQVIGSANNDVFSFGGAADGDHFVVDGGGGYNVLDLSGFDSSSISVDNDLVTVDMGGGESFTIEISNVDHFIADGVVDTPMLVTDGDQVVGEGESIQIQSTTFSSSEAPTSYTWTQVSGPVVDVEGGDTSQPSFEAPELDSNTVLRFRAEVSDGTNTEVEYVTIAVSADNDPVVIDMGPDQNVSEGDSVTLGASVVDPEGYMTISTWEQVSGPSVELENADSMNPSFTASQSTEDTELVFKLTASDGETEVVEFVTVHVDAVNDAAIVDAGEDFSVDEGKSVSLVGSAVDSDNGELTYSWRQTSGPSVTLSDASSSTATFEAPEGVVNTNVSFELTVSDGVNESTDSVTVTVNADDDAPKFNSLPTQYVGEHEAVELSASATDPEGNGVTYTWSQVGGTPVELSGADTQNPTFVSPEEITNSWLTFEVAASDGEVSSVGTVTVLVNAVNDAPTADAGANFAIDAGGTGTLTATGEDPEGKAVLFNWTQVSGPTVEISDATSSDATFGAPAVSEDTELVFQVEVTDGTSTSVDTITVQVNAGAEAETGGEGSSGSGEGGSGSEPSGETGGETVDPESGGGESGDGGSESGGGSDPVGETGEDPVDESGEGAGSGEPMVVEAPATIIATEGELTTLTVDVSNASDDVQYTWTQVAGTETLELSDSGDANPTFEAPNLTDNEIYAFDVTVEDESGSHTVRVNILVEADNDGPVVDVDDDPTQINESIYTVGSTSSDSEGQNLSYNWVQTDGPEVKIRSGSGPELRFSTRGLDEPGEITFELQVSDGTNITTDQIVMEVNPGNTIPTVSVGPDQSVLEGDTVQLTSAVSDEDGDALTYSWVQTSGPSVELSDANSASPTFEAPDISGTDEITFELTVSDGIDEVTDSVVINVEGINDAPLVDAGPFQSVNENELVTLSASVSDSDSENLTYTWTQTGGPSITLDGSDTATATFTAPDQIANSYATFEIEVSDGEHTVVDTVVVLINADNDAPTLDAGPNFSVDEETTVQLSATASDPEGSALTHNWVQTGGPEVTLSDPFSIDPTFDSPNVAGDTELTFQITTTDGENTVVDTVTVTVVGENDAPDPTNATTIASEDTPTSLVLAGSDPDIDQEITSFRIDSLPSTGTLTFEGNPVEAGDEFSTEQIESGNLVFTPPSDYSGNTGITFSVSDGEAWSAEPATQTIVVAGVADAPIITTADASGTEEGTISLNVDIALSDTDGSESIESVSVSGAPPGSILTDGVTTVTAWDGTADISNLNMSDLQIIPADNYDQDFTLTIAATSVEADSGDTTTGAATLDVHIDAVNDPPVAVDGTLDISEDQTATISLGSQEVDTGDEAANFRIESLPTNGTLMLDGVAVEAGDEISAYDVSRGQLTFEPAGDWSGSTGFDFSVSDGEVWSESEATFTINVSGVADAPLVTVSDAYGFEDSSISLDVSTAITDVDGSEEISRVAVSGAPAGSVFTDGVNTATSLGQQVDITGWDLSSLSVTPSSNYDMNFDLQFQVTSSEPDSGDTTTTTSEMTVHLDGVNDAPIVQAGSVDIQEDGIATIEFNTLELDTNDSVESIRIESLPGNGTLMLNGAEVSEGQVVNQSMIDDGLLTFEPDENWSGSTSIQFSAFDGDLWSETQGEHTINVYGVADVADLSVASASGFEDSPISLDISPALSDTDGSETLSVVVSNVPDGASLSAGIDNGDGSWTLSPDELDGLSVTPPSDFSGSFDLEVTAVSTEADGDTASAASTLTVSVEGVADGPSVEVVSASGFEDSPISLDISPALSDTDGSETLSVVVSNVPEGASLSAGIDNGDGSWTLNTDELDGLSVTPPSDFSGSFDLEVTAISTEADGDTASAASTLTVNVEGVADGPSVEVVSASGFEDSPISLDISSTLSDTDGSETLSVIVSNVPEGASLSAGVDNGDGSWTLNTDELDGLSVTPPSDFSGSFDLEVTAVSTEADGDTASTAATLTVNVEGVADGPSVEVATASGFEDSPISLDINPSTTDTDGSETLSVVVSNVPEGASLSAGIDNGDGSWTLSADDLDGLSVTPPSDFSGSFDLEVTAISTEADGDTATSAASTLTVNVEGVADGPTLEVAAASGFEDSPISLNISPSLSDTDGSEALSVVVSNVPEGASLSAGIDNGDGSWTLTTTELDGLSVTPPSDFSGSFDLEVTAVSTEADGDSATSAVSALTVNVEGVADGPTLEVTEASGYEDSPISLDIAPALSDTDGSETLSVVVSNVPEGASLSAGIDNGDGSWTLTTAELDELSVTPSNNFSGSFDLEVTAVSTEADGDSATSAASTLTVNVEGVADGPSVEVITASGFEDSPISLEISPALSDTDGSETLSVVVSNVPDGASLSAGVDNGDGSWTLTNTELDGLSVTPPSNFSGSFDLEVTAVSTEADGDSANSAASTLTVNVEGVADGPSVTVTAASGYEDSPISLDINPSTTDSDGSETLSIVVSNVPEGASLSAGIDNGDGSWTLSTDELDGLSVTPPSDFSGSFDLEVTSISTETDGDTATSVASTLTVNVEGIADGPSVEVASASGFEDSLISLDIAPALSDTDGSETLSVVVSNVPEGASLSAGIDNGDGSWTLSTAELDGLSITPPSDFSGSFDLDVAAVSTEADGNSATSAVSTLTVNVEGIADGPSVAVTTASGFEDSPISLDINPSTTDTDGSETLSVVVSNVPDGASLSAGIDNGDGSWTLSVDELNGLSVTPPSDFSGSFDLDVTSISTEADGDTATSATSTLTVNVEGVADGPVLEVVTATGFEDSPISLDINPALTDADGSESLSIVVSNVPEGASLSAGIDHGDGSWTLSPAELDGLSITPPSDYSGSFDLEITATSTESDGDTASTINTLTVEVEGVADSPNLETESSFGTQNTSIPLTISTSLTDTDGSESIQITIQGIPEGASLSSGVDNGDGSWTLSSADLEELSFIPDPQFSGQLELEVIATTTDGSSVATSEGSIQIDVYPIESESEVAEDIAESNPKTPTEIDWGDENDLGVVSMGSDIDNTFDEIDNKLNEVVLNGPDMSEEAEQMGQDLIGEITPMVAEAADNDAPVPPPNEPLFEFVRAENSDQMELDAQGVNDDRGSVNVEFGEGTQNEKASPTERFASTFTMLWGLVRSLGARDNNDEKQSSEHASRGRRR
jgi:large repetitive protein